MIKIILFLFPFMMFAQKMEVINMGIINNQAIHFQINEKSEVIDFIVLDTILTEKNDFALLRRFASSSNFCRFRK